MSSLSGLILSITAATIVLPLTALPSAASCPQSGPGVCHRDFTILSAVAAHSGGGFAAVGTLKASDGEAPRAGLLRVDPSGNPQSTIPIDPPAGLIDKGFIASDIIALAGGGHLTIGRVNYTFGDGFSSDVWLARTDDQGETVWSRRLENPPGSQMIVYRGTQLKNGRVVAVGRVQLGPGDATCSNWSRGLAVSIDADNPDATQWRVIDYLPAANRTAMYDVQEDIESGALLMAGFEASPTPDGAACQDDFVVMRTAADLSFAAQDVSRFGDPAANDIAYGVESGGNAGGLIVVGRSDGSGRPAIVARVRWGDNGLESAADASPLVRPVGESGRDRFVTALRLPDTGETIVGGYSSESDNARNRAWWMTLDADLNVVAEKTERAYDGSSIRDVARAADGTVLAVGHVWPQDAAAGDRLGWTRVIRRGESFRLASRAPNPDLPALEPSDGQADVGTAGTAGLAFRLPASPSGETIAARFEVAAPALVRIALLPFGGDADLVVTDAAGSLVGFSHHTDEAGELVETVLQSGTYVATVVAASSFDGAEIAIAALPDTTEPNTAPDFDVEARRRLADMLSFSGYDPGGSAEIAVGARMHRSLKAAAISGGVPVTAPLDAGDLDLIAAGGR